MNCNGHPVLVIGGGPAGLATALELARHGVAAVVIERSAYNDLRIGEHLQPAGVLQLRALTARLHLPLDAHFASAGVVAYWGSETAKHMDYFFQAGQHGLNLSRPRFDADLARACDLSGVPVWRSARLLRAKRNNSLWELDILEAGAVRSLSASMIVDATGRAAAFARRQGATVLAQDRQIAVGAVGEASTSELPHTRSLLEAAEIGWWYGASIGPERMICMLATDDDLLPRGGKLNLRAWWFDQLCHTAQLRYWLGAFKPSGHLFVRSARSQHLDLAFGNGWLAVGDAALAFDPLSSQGIANALDQGRRAASRIAAYFSGDHSALENLAHELQIEHAAYSSTRTRYYRLEMRWRQSVFWKRRHQGTVPSE